MAACNVLHARVDFHSRIITAALIPSPILLIANLYQELLAFYVQKATFFTTMDQAQHLVFLALTPAPVAIQVLSVLCAATVIKQDGNTCRADSIGFQIGFRSPNIIELDFASALTIDLTKDSISAQTDSTPSTSISTAGWTLNACLAGAKQCTITTDLTESQLPIYVDLVFNQA
eukprot:CAMPEP_0202954894 /NCGR_PEP_ID=MMETSP1395-20130829/51222_1 /ASSEMBLY_ACC=CAM_ASM_000871 /TAXON_ID=5961 /ORGANISM="Blepharisma japonicum, Strain Stock R1072" /LENGTH=173 /DNA_ID=CAMNT_0049670791 /DNA_START=506 /DNA_END=1029 /DNA_ORIENTATION=-